MTSNPTDGAGPGSATGREPTTPLAGAESSAPAASVPPPNPPTAASEVAEHRRALKVVVNLQPLPPEAAGDPDAAALGYRAVVGVGADGCDPVLRSLRVGGLAAALDEVPALAAEAETKWQSEPRNPKLAPSPAAKAARAGKGPSPASAGTKAPPPLAAPRPAAVPASATAVPTPAVADAQATAAPVPAAAQTPATEAEEPPAAPTASVAPIAPSPGAAPTPVAPAGSQAKGSKGSSGGQLSLFG